VFKLDINIIYEYMGSTKLWLCKKFYEKNVPVTAETGYRCESARWMLFCELIIVAKISLSSYQTPYGQYLAAVADLGKKNA